MKATAGGGCDRARAPGARPRRLLGMTLNGRPRSRIGQRMSSARELGLADSTSPPPPMRSFMSSTRLTVVCLIRSKPSRASPKPWRAFASTAARTRCTLGRTADAFRPPFLLDFRVVEVVFRRPDARDPDARLAPARLADLRATPFDAVPFLTAFFRRVFFLVAMRSSGAGGGPDADLRNTTGSAGAPPCRAALSPAVARVTLATGRPSRTRLRGASSAPGAPARRPSAGRPATSRSASTGPCRASSSARRRTPAAGA